MAVVSVKQEYPVSVNQFTTFGLGFNGYTNPAALDPRFWAASSNVYSGPFGTIRKARSAKVVIDGTTTGTTSHGLAYVSLYAAKDPTTGHFLLGDTYVNNSGTMNVVQYAFNPSSSYAATTRTNSMFGGVGDAIQRPWMRTTIQNIVWEMNGLIKQNGRGTLYSTIENFGLDAPDTSPSVAVSAGAITKTIGRSYR